MRDNRPTDRHTSHHGKTMKHVFLAFLLLASLPVWSDDDSPTSAIEVRFSPQQKTLALVLDTIASARHEILVAAYVFTSKPVALALRDARKRGIDVRVVADAHSRSVIDSATAAAFLDVKVNQIGKLAEKARL